MISYYSIILAHIRIFLVIFHFDKHLHINVYRDEIISLNTVVMATRILNPIIDKLNLIEESYTLDVYAKEKGDE